MPRSVDRTERLQAITDAVATIARTDGFSAVTIRKVADRLNSSTTVVTHYFSSRDDLVRHVVRDAIQTRTTELERHLEGLTGRDAVRALAEGAVLYPSDDLHRLWLAIVVGSAGDDLLLEELERFNRSWDDRLEEMVAEFVPPEPDPDTLVDIVNVVISGMVVMSVETDALWDHARRRVALDRLLTPLGLGPDQQRAP